MNENTNKLGSVVSGAMREKYWGEITEADKLERMRQVIKQIARRVEETSLEQYHLKNSFLEHKHLDGEIVSRIGSNDLRGDTNDVNARLRRISDGEGDNVYF